MTFKEYITTLNELLEEHPEYGNLETITAGDEEGNFYNTVYYTPSVGCWTGDDTFIPEDNTEDFEEYGGTVNAICVN